MPNYRHLGRFIALTDLGGSVLVRAERGLLELTPVAPGILRVRLARGRRLPPYESLAVCAPPAPAPAYELAPGASSTHLKAPGLNAVLAFEPARLHFARPGQAGAFMDEVEAGRCADHWLVRARLRPGEHVYGLGEKTGWLDRRHRRYHMRNSDVLLDNREGIGIATDPLYASFPVFLVHGALGSYGVFVDNPETTSFDFTGADRPGATYEFAAPAAVLTYYVLAGPGLPDVLRQYTDLTGRIPLPALWALGYHQCRWGYRTEADFRRVAAELRRRRIPADALWFDIDYMNGYRVFTWNRRRFPRPARLIADLKAQGLRSVTIVDPGLKVDERYPVYAEGHAAGYFIAHPDGREYHGSVWPGRSAFPDFHAPEVRAWWGGLAARWLEQTGVSGLWNDMNEPASTDLSGPIDEVRHGGGLLSHQAARNTYGLQMARATFAAMQAQAPDARPFILTRAAFSGAQTVTALWCGDNSAAWEHLTGSLPMLLNLGLSGMPFVGADIGGFAGDTHGELLARWFQAGAFYPFCRNHSVPEANAHEPWAFGPEVEAICRRYVELRYQLLPYTYSLFDEAARTGAPIMRPLVWHYPRDPLTFNLSDQFLFGRDLLVAPVTAPGQVARAVYLPRGRWYRWGAAQGEAVGGPRHVIAAAPLGELPLYVRGGAILPMWPVAQHTGLVRRQALRLHLWPGNGQFDLYEDDGETRAYERGEYRRTPFRLRSRGGELTLTWGPSVGSYASSHTRWTFVLHGVLQAEATCDGHPVKLRRGREGLVIQVKDDGEQHVLRLALG